MDRLEFFTLFSGEYDANNAIVSINAGAAARNPATGCRCFCACIPAGPRGTVLT
jgi:hypothetical protein